MPTQARLIAGLIIAAVVQTAIIAIPTIPLGVPGEWDWRRHALPASFMAAVAQFVPAIVGATVLLCVARFGNNRLFRQHRRIAENEDFRRHGPPVAVSGIMLLSLVFGTWVWVKTVERCTPAPHRNLKSMWVLYDPSSSGYFYEAAFKINSTSHFLSSYTERTQEGEVYHSGTHPPGLFVLSRWILQCCRNVPLAAAQLHDWIFSGDLKAFRALESSARLKRPLSESDLAALFLLSEMTTLAAACTVIPLFFTLRLCFDVLTAWRTTCLWATVPCLVVFLPKSDVLFTLTSMAAASFGIMALMSSHDLSKRLCFSVASGSVLWCGLMMSLAHLPVLALLGMVMLIRFVRDGISSGGLRESHSNQMRKSGTMEELPGCETEVNFSRKAVISRDLFVAGVIVATVAVLTLVFSIATDCDMFSVWQMNLRNHAAFYDVHTRTAWKWLIVNPLELGMAIGLPVALISLAGLRHGVAANWRKSTRDSVSMSVDMSLAVVLTISVLWISCRNSGEAARLWCFLTPWLMVIPAHLLGSESDSHRVVGTSSSVVWHTALLAQMVVCILTSGRVSGFSF